MLRKPVKMCGILLLITIMLAAAACGDKKNQDANESEETKAILVETAQVEKSDIASISTVSGKVAANVQVDVVPKMPGRVAAVYFNVGDRVKKGDVLVRLEDTEVKAGLESAQAALAMSKTGQEQAKAQYQDALKNLERMKSLFEEGAISQQQLEAAETGLKMADPNMAAAKLRQAEAAVKNAQAQLENTVIKSPANGIVSARNVEVGEIAAQMPVMTVVDIDPVVVETKVTESEVNKLKVGQKVDVNVEAAGKKPFQGVISSISPAAEERSSAFPVKIEIANPQHLLKPGMFAEVKLVLDTKKGAVVIPKEAVVDSGSNKTVFRIENNQAHLVEITTGTSDEKRVEVLSGLSKGQEVVIKGQHKLEDKTPVTVSGR